MPYLLQLKFSYIFMFFSRNGPCARGCISVPVASSWVAQAKMKIKEHRHHLRYNPFAHKTFIWLKWRLKWSFHDICRARHVDHLCCKHSLCGFYSKRLTSALNRLNESSCEGIKYFLFYFFHQFHIEMSTNRNKRLHGDCVAVCLRHTYM